MLNNGGNTDAHSNCEWNSCYNCRDTNISHDNNDNSDSNGTTAI